MYSRTRRTLEVCLVALSIVVPCRLASADAITVTWDNNTDSFAGYKVYVGTQSGTYSQKFDVGTATTFTLTTAVAGQRYCFALTAYSSSSLESPKSKEVCGYSNAPPTLTNPGNRTSTVGQPTSVQLTGSDPEGQPLTFSATGLPPGLSLMTSTGYISGTGTTAGNYAVAVKASDGVVSSATQSFTWAMIGTTTPPSPPPPAAVTLSAEKIDRSAHDQVQLTWTTASWSEVWVYRNGTQISQTANDGAFTDDLRRASGSYTYRVCAPNASTCSNNVTVTF
jgi:putative Ig domain-containing protein